MITTRDPYGDRYVCISVPVRIVTCYASSFHRYLGELLPADRSGPAIPLRPDESRLLRNGSVRVVGDVRVVTWIPLNIHMVQGRSRWTGTVSSAATGIQKHIES